MDVWKENYQFLSFSIESDSLVRPYRNFDWQFEKFLCFSFPSIICLDIKRMNLRPDWKNFPRNVIVRRERLEFGIKIMKNHSVINIFVKHCILKMKKIKIFKIYITTWSISLLFDTNLLDINCLLKEILAKIPIYQKF